MRLKLYNALVNRREGIAYRYHRFHDGQRGIMRFISWLYLLWLNFAYYVLFMRFLGKKGKTEYYESKRLPVKASESELGLKDSVTGFDELIYKLEHYDVVSLDVFDTLILRPLSEPADVFYFVGEALGILDFKRLRINAEQEARKRCKEKNGHTEVTLRDIWEVLAEDLSIDAETGMREEIKAETSLCYVNPFMYEVWKRLRKSGKRLIIVSDMYLPEETISEILKKNNIVGFEKAYISCEYGKSKAEGSLYDVVLKDLNADGGKTRVFHIGDNPHSDDKMARKAGFDVYLYPQTNRKMRMYRPYDMSSIVGSAYRGIVSNHLYNGYRTYSQLYEYGYLYGGLFSLGYCNFIHNICKREGIDKILFLSRDGEILRRVYVFLFPGEDTEYVLWSRKAATKLMASENRQDYFRRFIYHKTGSGITITDALKSMELTFLAKQISESDKIKPDDKLTSKNAEYLQKFLEKHWAQVQEAYVPQSEAACAYYRKSLDGCKKVAVVDIGWAGSGAVSLSHLVTKVWNIPCEIKSIVAGTNTIHNSEPDASEHFLQSGKMEAYLYSQSHNRDLLKKHDPGKDYNVFWEMLVSSANPKFEGFYTDGPHYGENDVNPEVASSVQLGIIDFAINYCNRFYDYPYMRKISGRDAYAPMLVAASHGEKYLKHLKKQFDLDINV